jgi:hypothetical protein
MAAGRLRWMPDCLEILQLVNAGPLVIMLAVTT